MKISILTPTRQREWRAKKFAHSVLSTAAVPEEIEMLFYIDSDDPELVQYSNWHLESSKQIKIYVGDPISISKSWNIIADKCIGDILIMGNDDLVYHTSNWDNILHHKIMEYPDNIYVAWVNDGINGSRHCAFPMVSRKWYEILGYFTPGIFEFLYNDTWIYDIGKILDRLIYIPEIYNEHQHFSTGKMQADETTMRPRRSGSVQRDKKLFERTINKRKKDAEKLINYKL